MRNTTEDGTSTSSSRRPDGGVKPIVIVDSREASIVPKVVEELKGLGAEVKTATLPSGDYIVSSACAVERKTVRDFVHTLMRRHLFEQLFELKEAYERPIVILEGYLPMIYKFSKIKPSSIWGAMFALVKNGIAIVPTANQGETAGFLYTAALQEQALEERAPAVHPVKKLETLPEAQVFFMSSLPSLGRERAVAILKSYGTPINALINVDRWQLDVKGLGPKTVKKVKEVLCALFEG